MTEKTFPYWAWTRLRDKLCSEGPFTTKLLLQWLGSVIRSKWACSVGVFRFFTLLGPRVLLCQSSASVEWCWIYLLIAQVMKCAYIVLIGRAMRHYIFFSMSTVRFDGTPVRWRTVPSSHEFRPSLVHSVHEFMTDHRPIHYIPLYRS